MRTRSNADDMYDRFRDNPSPVYFSPILAERPDLHGEILELIKNGEPDELVSMAYRGNVNHAAFGRIEWFIFELPTDDINEFKHAMTVRLYDEFWLSPQLHY